MSGPRSDNTFVFTQWLFLRAVGLVYFCAFLSLVPQIQGLIGSGGILPVQDYLTVLGFSIPPDQRMLAAPTLLWYNSSDAALLFLCWGGVLASLGIMLSVATGPLLVVAWLFYGSLMTVGQDFLSFQWDSLLLEAGFLAIFWTPWRLLDAPWRTKLVLEPKPWPFQTMHWLVRCLLFKLMFMSGLCKLQSQDITWRDLTALKYHYWTQPLPTPPAWLMAQAPDWFQRVSAGLMFGTELVVPFLFFTPRPFRYLGAACTIFLQVLILLTGNYTFFNLLTIALCIVLIDDRILTRLLPSTSKSRLVQQPVDEIATEQGTAASRTAIVRRRLTQGIAAVIAVVVGLPNLNMLSSELAGFRIIPGANLLTALTESTHIISGYGLFAMMTKTRPEISVEGSDDGVTWKPYTFWFKPGPLDRPPPIVAPYQPRLDWQMWFAALGPLEQSPWFVHFAYKLLQGSPDVVHLLKDDPFHGQPPKMLRATLYEYRFTDFAEMQTTHNWWKRTEAGIFLPPISLKNFSAKL